jgi:hypothetical protein
MGEPEDDRSLRDDVVKESMTIHRLGFQVGKVDTFSSYTSYILGPPNLSICSDKCHCHVHRIQARESMSLSDGRSFGG